MLDDLGICMLFAQYYVDGKQHEVIQKGFPKRNALKYRYFYNEKECRDYIQDVLKKSWYAKESLLKLPLLSQCDSQESLENTFVKLVMEKKLEVTLDCPIEMPAMVRPRYVQKDIVLPKPPPVPEPKGENLDFKIVVEVAGNNISDGQRLSLSKDSQGRELLQNPQTVTGEPTKHRSLVSFKKIPEDPRSIFLQVAMKGEPPLRLKLLDNAATVDEKQEKECWEHILIPLKPLGYITDALRRDQTDILPDGGWVYVFWKGKLWRELKVIKGVNFRDVRVEYYRNQRHGQIIKVDGDLRPALGVQLNTIWVPYKLNGEVQQAANGVYLLFSMTQWSWDKISEFESDTTKLQQEATSVDQLTSYEQEQHFNHPTGAVGPIAKALTNQTKTEEEQELDEQAIPRISKHPKLLDRQRNTKIPAVYLKAIDKRLIMHFETDCHAPIDRNDLFELRTNNGSWQHASKPTLKTAEAVDGTQKQWIELIFHDVPEGQKLNLQQTSRVENETPFIIIKEKTYEELRCSAPKIPM